MQLKQGIEVHLKVNGEYLPESAAETGECPAGVATKVSAYVEATSGCTFSVDLRFRSFFHHRRDDIDCRVFVDGQRTESSVASPRKHKHTIIEGSRSSTGGRWVLRRFMFADLHTSDDKPSATMRETLKDRGTIRVEFRRGRISHYDDGNFKESFRSVGSSVPEKGLKGRAISNRIELGAMEPIRAVGTVQLEWPYGKEPFATAVFNYRSRKDLQIEGIIPRSPTPVPLEEREPDDLTAEEAREVIRRMKAREQRVKVEIKSEKRDVTVIEDDDEDDGEDDVIVESETRARKRQCTLHDSGVEIVDLLDD